MKRLNDLRSIGIAFRQYEDSHGILPVTGFAKENLDKDGKPFLSWRVHLLPYLEQQALYEQFHLNEPWDSEHNKKLIEQMPAIYQTTDDKTKTTLVVFVGPRSGVRTPFTDQGGRRLAEFIDGPRNTLLMVEAAEKHAVPWTKPEDLPFDAKQPLPELGRAGEDFFLAIFADGRTARIPKSVTEKALKALITINGKEPVDANF